MKPPIPYKYGRFSEARNSYYWTKHVSPTDSAEMEGAFDKLLSLDTLAKLIAFMKRITYTPDTMFAWMLRFKLTRNLRFATGHWWQWAITTIHRMKGDCEDMARMWYECLRKLGYDATVYICYRKFWKIELPWHFVCVWREKENYELPWHVASNNNSGRQTHNSEAGVAIGVYRKRNGYSSAVALSHKDITGEAV